ncbi:hypothetical protein [Dactylosporangium sp. NPDC049140]|uniref:hypothetical protein n=1 Tax=Dactylosporangium sp. NPDC049140 TaxID=3155647 RepID=UPI0033F03599
MVARRRAQRAGRGDSGVESQQRLIVDPATGQALGLESWTNGKRGSYTAILKAEWSNGALPAATDLN